MQMFGKTPSEKAMPDTLVNIAKENSQEDAENIPLTESKEVAVIPSSKSLSTANCKYEDREANDRHEYEDVQVADHQDWTPVEGDSGSRREEGVSKVEIKQKEEIKPHPVPVDFETVVKSDGTTVTSSEHSVVDTLVDEVTSQQSIQGGQL